MFRTNVTLVAVPMTVTDANGQPVLDVAPTEVHVLENGVEQRVDRLISTTAPSSVALLLDTSGSMPWKAQKEAQSVAIAASAATRPQDSLMVVSFDERIRVHTEFTTDRMQIAAAVSQITSGLWRGTRLYDAIDLVARDRLDQVTGRKAILLFTDGVDTRSQLADGDAALAASDASGAVVYVMRYEPTNVVASVASTFWLSVPGSWLVVADDGLKNTPGADLVGEFLQRLSTGSGGRQYLVRDITDLRPVFDHIVGELGHQYTLGYYPTNMQFDGSYRQVTVSVDRPGCTVRARKGYRAIAPVQRDASLQ